MEYESEAGTNIIVEVEESEGLGRVSRPGEVAAKAGKTLEDALSIVCPTADAAYHALQRLTVKPEEVSVAFGVRLTVKAGAIIAESQGEAHFEVSLRWKMR
jgi:hypothetical protein